jgi:hypothetical protein
VVFARLQACLLTLLFITASSLSGNEAWRLVLPDAVISDGGRAKVQNGSAVVEVLPARGRELAVFGVVTIGIDGHRLASWVRQVEELQRSTYIPLAHRFSDPPTLDDVRELTLDDQDLQNLRECRPGDCGLKLSAPEIAEIQRAIAAAGAEWKGAAQAAFRHVLVSRAHAYKTHGHAGAAPYHDHKTPVSPDEEFQALSRNMKLDMLAPAEMASYLRSYPRVNGTTVESFLYWSKETLGGSKPIIAITHVSLFRGTEHGSGTTLATRHAADAVTVAFKQVYATHYLTASLSLTSLTPAVGGSPRYLVYTRRSRTDVLGGAFGGIVRRLIERRIRSEAPSVLDRLRRRLETEPTRETALYSAKKNAICVSGIDAGSACATLSS